MKRILWWLGTVAVAVLTAGCLVQGRPNPAHRTRIHSPAGAARSVVWPTPPPPQSTRGPRLLATAPRNTAVPLPSATPTPALVREVLPTPVPDYFPGRGMAVLVGEGPYMLSILRGGWQAVQIGPAQSGGGYLVDITPLEPAVDGAHVEYKILPEYDGSQWVDVLWLRAPELVDSLPIRLDLISTADWPVTYRADVRLTPGDWMGFAMFDNGEGCGGVLDIDITDPDAPGRGTSIHNTRVQPEFPGQWLQVARVQLSSGSISQQALLRYFAPGERAEELLRMEVTLEAGVWSGWAVADSQAHQGYVVEVMPLRAADNEVAAAVVQPEFNGVVWQDVLRVLVPQGRPPLEALVRVLAVPAAPAAP